MKILVTGVTGQTGTHMVDYLIKETNHYVVGSARRTSKLLDENFKNHYQNGRFRLIHLDLDDSHSIISTVKNEKPDIIFNFGGRAFVPDSWNSPEATIKTNTIAIIHFLEAIRNHCPDCRFMNACSSEIFGDVLETPQKETTKPNPRSVYGVSKNSAREIIEVYRKSYGLYAYSSISFNHEGELRQKYYVSRKITSNVARIKKSIDNGEAFEPLKLGNIDARRDWSYALDLVEAIYLTSLQDKPKDYVLSSGDMHSVREFVELAFKFAGIEGVWFDGGTEDPTYEVFLDQNGVCLMSIDKQFYRPAEVDLLWGDSSLARKELDWSPKTSFKELVEKMVINDLNLINNC